MTAHALDSILEPIRTRRAATRWSAVLLTAAAGYWLASCMRVLREGHLVLGTSSYGAAWGLGVANIIHIIGISHVGIAISAAVRVLRLERYRNISRLAEITTLVSLLMAVVNIALDVGRPDRFVVNTLLYGRWHAPMVWSATVITLYLLSSGVYLYLSLRRDLGTLSTMGVPGSRLYGLLSLGYRDTVEDRRRHDRTLYWLAIALIPIMVSVHSVYGLFFGLLSAKAGWYNPLQAPYFVLGAVVSGFSALIVLAALLRRIYRWHELIDDRTFRALGSILAFVVFLYLYFVVSEQVTGTYTAPPAEAATSDALLTGGYAPLFWLTIVGGLLVPFALLFREVIRDAPFRVGRVVVAAAAVNVAMFAKRVLLVVPPQQNPRLPLPVPESAYLPSHVEWTVTLGTYAVGALLLLAVLKLVPVIELPAPPPPRRTEPSRHVAGLRAAAVTAIGLVGSALILWGVATAGTDLAPLKWISGLCLWTTVPLAACLIGSRREPAPSDIRSEPDGS